MRECNDTMINPEKAPSQTNERWLDANTCEKDWTDQSLTLSSRIGPAVEGPFEVAQTAQLDLLLICKAKVKVCYSYNGGRSKEAFFAPSDFGFLPKGASVYGVFEQQSPSITVGFPSHLREQFEDQHKITCSLDEPRNVTSGLINASTYTALIDDFLNSASFGGSLRVESIVNMLLGDVYRSIEKSPSACQEQVLRREALEIVVEFIDANVDEKISIEMLASLVNVSPFHFARLFKATTGLPPHQFIIKHRLEKAKSLLKHSNLSLLEAALACGFSSQSHMSETFRKSVGVSPGSFRKSFS